MSDPEQGPGKLTTVTADTLYHEMFASSPDGLLLIDAESQRIIEFNDAACRQLGYTREEFRGLCIADFEASKTVEEIDARIQEALHAGKTEFDTLQRTRTGEIRHVHVWAKRFDLDGRAVFHAIFRDITELKQTEQSLHRSLDLLDRTGRLAKIGGWELNLDTQTLRWTEELYRIHEVDLAFTPTVAAAITFYAPEARPVITAAVEAAILAGTPFDLDLPLVTGQGRRIWVRAQGTAERRDGRTFRLFGTFQDITKRRATEELLRLQSAALDAAADVIVITDPAGTIEWVNPAFTAVTGYTSEEAVGKHHRDLVESGKQGRAFYQDLWETILAGRTWRGELVNCRKDGSLYPLTQVVTPILSDAGVITHFVSIQQDITDRQRLEAQFRQAQRMESVGQLASGIAHDFNNLLTVINGMSDLLLAQIRQDDPVHADVEEIHRAGQRAATLTRQLLAFSRQQILQPQVLNLQVLVAKMQSLLRHLVDESIDLVVVPAADVGNVRADPGQIEQVITNLVVNARDAMPRGGSLSIEVQNVTLDEEYARQHGAVVPPGPYVMLSVSDSGIGMDEATLARVFEPFFTTKGPDKGTGLGLSTAYGIVKQSHGFIWVYSEVGHGTVFRIYLPQVFDEADAGRPEPTSATPVGSETVLLVEDNAGLHRLVTRVLETAGYTVLAAVTGEEAQRVLERHRDPVHLLLTDLVMPGMSGRQLAELLAQSRPTLKVLYMSGYTSDTLLRHGVSEAQVTFLGKPFTAASLLRKVREALDAEVGPISPQ